jgi:hypothetical protein
VNEAQVFLVIFNDVSHSGDTFEIVSIIWLESSFDQMRSEFVLVGKVLVQYEVRNFQYSIICMLSLCLVLPKTSLSVHPDLMAIEEVHSYDIEDMN